LPNISDATSAPRARTSSGSENINAAGALPFSAMSSRQRVMDADDSAGRRVHPAPETESFGRRDHRPFRDAAENAAGGMGIMNRQRRVPFGEASFVSFVWAAATEFSSTLSRRLISSTIRAPDIAANTSTLCAPIRKGFGRGGHWALPSKGQ
jgi:hypothetical protein